MATKTKTPVVDINIVRGPIMHTWNAVGYDAMAEGRISNLAAVECCIDANRLTSFAYGESGKAAAKAAEAEIDRAIAAHGYPKVLRAIGRAISLT
jgi:hypothetical protein